MIAPALHCGDCRDVLARLAPASVDVVVTSPPYNLDLGYATYRDRREESEYLDWMVGVATAVRRAMRPDASFFLNITWIKSIATGADSVGHYKPVGGQRFLNHAHEHIFHLTLDGAVKLDRLAIGVPFKDKSNIARRGHARDLRCRGNTWFIPYATVQSKAAKFHHPGTFPLDLPRWCIRLHGRAAPVVLDPFMGTGTTLIAALLEGGSGIGIDIDPAYVAIARDRVAATISSFATEGLE